MEQGIDLQDVGAEQEHDEEEGQTQRRRRGKSAQALAAEEAAAESSRELGDIIKWLSPNPIQTIDLEKMIYMPQAAGQARAFSQQKMDEQYGNIQKMPPSMPLNFAIRDNNGVYLC